MTQEPEILWAHCNQCEGDKKHILLADRKATFNISLVDRVDHRYITYQLLECCGCESVKLRTITEDATTKDPRIEYFPYATSRRIPVWLEDLSPELRELFQEVYAGLFADCRRLAVMGARAILDLMMKELLGADANFEENLREMEAQQFVTPGQRKFLEAALEAGHAAIHRGHKPDNQQVGQVMDLVEHVVSSNYVLTRTAENLKGSVPGRVKRQKRPS